MSYYILKHFDTPLIEFELSLHFDGPTLHILQTNDSFSHLFPLDLQVTEEGLLQWLRARMIPANRAYANHFLAKLGLNPKDIKGMIDACRGLSLNDCYWVVPSDFTGAFADYNLFEHRFSESLALMAFTGTGRYLRPSFQSSPEFTTNGMLAKCWRRVNREVLLYKSGTEGGANTGNEPYSEFYACQVAEAMGLDAVKYGLSRWKDRLCSTCSLFTDMETSYIPIGRLVKGGGMRAVLAYVSGLGEDYHQALADLLVFDAVILNTDRHLGNFGVLVNNRTNQITAMAPIFDNGYGLFPMAMEDDLRQIDRYIKTRTPAAYPDFMEMARAVLGPRQRQALRRLVTFTPKKHARYNRDSLYLEAVTHVVRQRASELLR